MFTWFDYAWPWIGAGLAAVLLVLLFATNLLRTEPGMPRHRDLRWLAFLAVAVYMVHNIEEYGIAANGVLHAFPDSLCTVLGQPAYPECGIPPVFYLFVNLPLVWIVGPLAAVLFGRLRLAALTLWGVIAINALVHIGPAIAQREYDPGLVTAVILFVPLSVLTARAILTQYRRPAIPVLLVAGVLLHAVLAGTALLYLGGRIPEWLLLAAQPAILILVHLLVRLAEPRLRRS